MTKVFFHEDDDLIDIRYDNVFKAVFTRDSQLSNTALSKLISALIGRELSVESLNVNEPPINSLKDRQIRFDINCRAENGELVNVEMSLNPDRFELVRLEYYSGKLLSGQDISGRNRTYKNLNESYQIAILANKHLLPDEVFLHTFEYYDPIHAISLNGKSRIITLELSKLDKIAQKPANEMSTPESWAFYFAYLTDKKKRSKINEILEREEGIAMASKVIMNISKDEIERARITSELKYELDTKSKLVEAKLEGIQEMINLLKSGKSPEEIIREYENVK